MDWVQEFEDHRPRYRLCQAGFACLALSLGLLCFSTGVDLVQMLVPVPALQGAIPEAAWDWAIGAPITWLSVVGSLLLWGRWREPSWRRRAGLLLLLNTLDALSWTYEHRADLGFEAGPLPQPWLRSQLSVLFGWIELALAAGLAADVAHHLSKAGATDAGRSARGFATVGGVVGVLLFFCRTNWHRWPLRPVGFWTLEMVLLMVGQLLLLILTTFQVTALSILASRQCRQFVRELDHDQSGSELLRSRSETSGDPWA